MDFASLLHRCRAGGRSCSGSGAGIFLPVWLNRFTFRAIPIKYRPQQQTDEFRRHPGSSTQGGNMNIRETAPRITELEKISTRTDTRDYLAKASSTTEKLKDWLVVDVDAHVNETAFWSEITDRIDNEVLRYIGEAFRDR